MAEPVETARQLSAAIRSGATQATTVTRAALQRCETLNAATNALYAIHADRALATAAALDQAVAEGRDPGPLAGVPIVVKDNICEQGLPCTCGSRILQHYTAPYDAEVVTRLKTAGAVLLARANMDEFAMGSSNETCAWGIVRNPWDLDRVPGGSSGGSAVAVAGGGVSAALGSDTGGSMRLPAAFTGIVGMKPSYGRVSRRGLVAYASSTDQVSPCTRDVRDSALLTTVLSGHDPGDSTCADAPVEDWLAACERGVEGRRIGVVTEAFGEGLSAGVRKQIERGLAALEAAGAVLVDVSLPTLKLAVACYYIIAPAEASANLARFDGLRYGHRAAADTVNAIYGRTRDEGFGAEVKRRILIGTYVLSAGYVDAYYRKAQRVRAQLASELAFLFEQVDALATPTAPTTAFTFGAHADPVSMYLTDIYTIPASLAGLPAISLPCGQSEGLPVGLQITARRFDESTCFAVGGALEAVLGPTPQPQLVTASPR